MEKQFIKLLGKEVKDVNIIFSDTAYKTLLCSCVRNGLTVYFVFKMFSIGKPQLNEDGAEVTEKQWKHFFPIMVKATTNKALANEIFDLLIFSNDEYNEYNDIKEG